MSSQELEYLRAKVESLEKENLRCMGEIKLLREAEIMHMANIRVLEEFDKISQRTMDRTLKKNEHLRKCLRSLAQDHKSLKDYVDEGYKYLKGQIEVLRNLSRKNERVIEEILNVMYENKDTIWGSSEVIRFVEDTRGSILRGTFPEE